MSFKQEILHDHEEIREYYSKIKELLSQKNVKEAHKYFNLFVWEIARHHVGEELVLYPLMDGMSREAHWLANESRMQHQNIKETLKELDDCVSVDTDLYKDNVVQLLDSFMLYLDEHLHHEETHDLTFLDSLSSEDDKVLAEKFTVRKKISPTRPHPHLGTLSSLLMTPIDKLLDHFRDFPTE